MARGSSTPTLQRALRAARITPLILVVLSLLRLAAPVALLLALLTVTGVQWQQPRLLALTQQQVFVGAGALVVLAIILRIVQRMLTRRVQKWFAASLSDLATHNLVGAHTPRLDESTTPKKGKKTKKKGALIDSRFDALDAGMQLLQYWQSDAPLRRSDSMVALLWSAMVALISPAASLVCAAGWFGATSWLYATQVRLAGKARRRQEDSQKRRQLLIDVARMRPLLATMAIGENIKKRLAQLMLAETNSDRSLETSTWRALNMVALIQFAVFVIVGAILVTPIGGTPVSAPEIVAALYATFLGALPFFQMALMLHRRPEAKLAQRALSSIAPLRLSQPARQAVTHWMPTIHGEITLKEVTLLTPKTHVPLVSGLNLRLVPGRVLGVTGPSSCGKSALARLIAGAWPEYRGQVLIDEVELADWDRVVYLSHTGYLPQQEFMLDGTIGENVAQLSTRIDGEKVLKALSESGAEPFVAAMPGGIAASVSSMLPGGLLRKLSLARALYFEPQIVILDAPLMNLDADDCEHVEKLIARLRQRNATVLIVADAPSLLARCDDIVVLKDGQVVLHGEAESVLAEFMDNSSFESPPPSLKSKPTPPPMPGAIAGAVAS